MSDPIRPIALGLRRDHEGRYLVERGKDGVRAEHSLGGIGGGIEFGERAIEALYRDQPDGMSPARLVDLRAQLGVEAHSSAS